jgi:hypothetical protein
MGEMRNAYKMLDGKPEGQRPFGDGVDRRIVLKSILEGVGYKGMEWIRLTIYTVHWRAVRIP